MIASPILTYCIIRSGNLLVTLMCGVYSRSYCLNPQIVWPKPDDSVPLLHLSLDRKVWWDNKHTLACESCLLKAEKRQVFFSDPWIPYLGPFPRNLSAAALAAAPRPVTVHAAEWFHAAHGTKAWGSVLPGEPLRIWYAYRELFRIQNG